MAQGVRRPARHGRQQSRGIAIVNGGEKKHEIRSNESDEATINHIKRVLCRKTPSATQADSSEEIDHKSLEDLLPPLTSSNEIDVQLYALIAVVLNLFVQSWYNKITPDQDFVANVVQIIAHCTRGLEQRLRNVDLEDLLLDALPGILAEHIDAIRIASRTQTSIHGSANRITYHALRPHHALTPVPNSPDELADQQENESAWCQMVVNRALALLLPYDEHQNPCLQVLVSEILSEMIFHNGICGKACESWLIWEGVTKVIYTLRPDLVPAPQPVDLPPVNQLKQFGLVSKEHVAKPELNARRRFDVLSQGFWVFVQNVWLAWVLMRSAIVLFMQASSMPARSAYIQHSKPGDARRTDILVESSDLGSVPARARRNSSDLQKPPILSMSISTCLSELMRLHDRMPWLTGALSLIQCLLLSGPGRLCSTDSRLDRLLSHTIHTRVLNAAHLPPALQSVRRAIFPDDALGPARVLPSDVETLAIKRECARVIVEIVPPFVRGKYFATDDVELMRADVEDWIGLLFGDAFINKHLVVEIVECIVLRLFPEIGEE